MLRVDVTVACDGRLEDGHCLSEIRTVMELIPGGVDRVMTPRGWSCHDNRWLCPRCGEQVVLARLIQTSPPDGSADPAVVRDFRKWQKEEMRQIVREELETAAEAKALKAPAPLVEGGAAISYSEREPNFAGHVGTGVGSMIEVRVKGAFVEITWPEADGSSLVLRHSDFTLVERPPFLDPVVYEWVKNGVKTMRGGAVTNHEDPIAH
jgi:hypothetical protein